MSPAEDFVATPSQTVGPFFAIGLQPLCSDHVPQPGPASTAPCVEIVEIVEIEGRILDAAGVPVPDAFLELWQADAAGRYSTESDLFDLLEGPPGRHARFPGFARVSAEPEGTFRFTTVQPGCVAYDERQTQAPHLLVLVFMRGLLRNLVTRMYFPDPATATDPVLQLVPPERRGTLIATETTPGHLRWDIRLRGDHETVFFSW